MVPNQVPEKLRDLSQFKEMLISRVLLIIQVYTKPGIGCIGSRVHIVTLRHNVQKVSDILPQCPKDITITVFTFKVKITFLEIFI